MKAIPSFLLLVLIIAGGCTDSKTNAQTNNISQGARVGGECEGCEAIYENTTPFNALGWQLTLPDYNDKGPKLNVTGTVYRADGKTPAAGVILYFYHTDQSGRYPQKGNETGWGRRHGYIRGWLKTNSKGQYSILTLRPGTYPNRGAAAHIHCIVKEDKINEYYIGDFLFDDDPLLTVQERSPETPGGNGVLKLQERDGVFYSSRDIYLGKNIRNYPSSAKQVDKIISSGLALGSNCPAFDPTHVSGPDKGKNACPMCKYGKGQGIMVWWNKEDITGLASFAENMERAIHRIGFDKLRVFIIYMNTGGKSIVEIEEALNSFSSKNELRNVAITYIPSPTDGETAALYEINPKADNTILIYRKRKVVDKFVNFNIEHSQKTLVRKLNLELSQIL